MRGPTNALFRDKLAAGGHAYGLWITLEAPAIADIAAGLGLDWVVIDSTSGPLGWSEITEHVRATRRSSTLALVRLDQARTDLLQRAIAIGADGVVIPRVETVEQLQSAVECAQKAASEAYGWNTCVPRSAAEMRDNLLFVAMIETEIGLQNLSKLLLVEGVDILFFDPKLSSTRWSAGEIRGHKKYAGTIALTDQDLQEWHGRGVTMLGLGTDGGIISDGIRSAMDLVDKPLPRPLVSPANNPEIGE